jgi:hypothetical protein
MIIGITKSIPVAVLIETIAKRIVRQGLFSIATEFGRFKIDYLTIMDITK